MRLIDLKCPTCGHITIDHLQRTSDEAMPSCPHRTQNPDIRVRERALCGTQMERVHLPTKRGTVIGDECDVWVQHGICNDDGTPRHFNSKSDMRKVAASKGLENHVVHQPEGREGDRSRHTSRWV